MVKEHKVWKDSLLPSSIRHQSKGPKVVLIVF